MESDSSSEDEVFFGPVTAKEERIAARYKGRRTLILPQRNPLYRRWSTTHIPQDLTTGEDEIDAANSNTTGTNDCPPQDCDSTGQPNNTEDSIPISFDDNESMVCHGSVKDSLEEEGQTMMSSLTTTNSSYHSSLGNYGDDDEDDHSRICNQSTEDLLLESQRRMSSLSLTSTSYHSSLGNYADDERSSCSMARLCNLSSQSSPKPIKTKMYESDCSVLPSSISAVSPNSILDSPTSPDQMKEILTQTKDQRYETLETSVKKEETLETGAQTDETLETQIQTEETDKTPAQTEETVETQPETDEFLETETQTAQTEETLDTQAHLEETYETTVQIEETLEIQPETDESLEVETQMEETYETQPKTEETLENETQKEETYKTQLKMEETYETQPRTEETYETQPKTEETYETQPKTEETLETQIQTKETYKTQSETKETYENEPKMEETLETQPKMDESLETETQKEEILQTPTQQTEETLKTQAQVEDRETSEFTKDDSSTCLGELDEFVVRNPCSVPDDSNKSETNNIDGSTVTGSSRSDSTTRQSLINTSLESDVRMECSESDEGVGEYCNIPTETNYLHDVEEPHVVAASKHSHDMEPHQSFDHSNPRACVNQRPDNNYNNHTQTRKNDVEVNDSDAECEDKSMPSLEASPRFNDTLEEIEFLYYGAGISPHISEYPQNIPSPAVQSLGEAGCTQTTLNDYVGTSSTSSAHIPYPGGTTEAPSVHHTNHLEPPTVTISCSHEPSITDQQSSERTEHTPHNHSHSLATHEEPHAPHKHDLVDDLEDLKHCEEPHSSAHKYGDTDTGGFKFEGESCKSNPALPSSHKQAVSKASNTGVRVKLSPQVERTPISSPSKTRSDPVKFSSSSHKRPIHRVTPFSKVPVSQPRSQPAMEGRGVASRSAVKTTTTTTTTPSLQRVAKPLSKSCTPTTSRVQQSGRVKPRLDNPGTSTPRTTGLPPRPQRKTVFKPFIPKTNRINHTPSLEGYHGSSRPHLHNLVVSPLAKELRNNPPPPLVTNVKAGVSRKHHSPSPLTQHTTPQQQHLSIAAAAASHTSSKGDQSPGTSPHPMYSCGKDDQILPPATYKSGHPILLNKKNNKENMKRHCYKTVPEELKPIKVIKHTGHFKVAKPQSVSQSRQSERTSLMEVSIHQQVSSD